MGKDTLFTGQPVFTQLLQLVPRHLVSQAARENSSDHYYKRFMSYDHLVTMLYASFHGCRSLREVVTGMMACNTRLNHLGIKHMPRRSTLAEANGNRDEKFFGGLYHKLYGHFYPDSRLVSKLESRLFIFDSTTISLFSEVMRGSGQKPAGKRKGGVKAHVLIKADEEVPRFVCLTEAKDNDNIFTPMLTLPKGSIVTFDRIYYGFKPLAAWSKSKVTWVTRMHTGVAYKVRKNRRVLLGQREAGIISDELILAGARTRKDKLPARRITYKDPVSGNILVFLTNNTVMKAATVADIYKKRWQIECLFKRIKQNCPLRHFLGDNENAIKVQIWCALIADLLIKIVKDKVERKWSFANIAAMVRLHLMTYIHLIRFLEDPEKCLENYERPGNEAQMSLFPT